ncbi:Neurogenic locus Notch protein [Diplonema papillatum]|nr:Neurogenic locus Notch protein [Diplonema papillatum]
MNDNELDCKSDHEDCSWVSKKCVVRPCTRPDTKPDCVKDGNGKECAWQKDPCGGPELQCMHAGCKAWTSSTVCKADARCQWVNSKCAFKTCSENDNDECCDARAECHWDLKTTPATCQIKECYTLTTNAKCEANKDCMWNESPKGCVDLHCQFHLTQCACMRNDNCYWKSGSEEQCVAAKYGLCPAMDIVLIFPGSTSMSYKFEHHPNGYLAFTEHIRNWVREIPLTKAPAGVTTQSGNTEAARVSLIQYGTDGSAAKIATAPAAKGQLSGTFAQLDSDLTWHEDNPVGGDHKILPALKLAYKNFNERDWKDSPPDDGVERILIIVTDQQILDTDDTKDVIDNMDFLRVNRYGIVVRRQATATKVDVDASASLKKLTSADQSKHFTDLNLDELPDLLHKFCDPVHEWGSNIEHIVPGTTINKHLPCMFYLQEATCKKDRGCFWSTSTKTCTTSPCLEHCTAADCHAENNMECSWTNVHCENIPDTVCDCKYDEADLAANKRHCETEPDKCSWKGTLCVIDQCATGSTGDIICKSNGQQCVDPDPSPCTDDWYCECVAPLTRDPYTSPTQAKAVCVLNECLASCSTCENGACAKKDQDCFDHNSAPTSTEDWGCRCRSPFEGAAIGKVATCAINECNVTCDHCENGLCATAGQGCNDPDDTNSSDWACLCPEPSVMYEIGAVVDQCLFDECLEYNGTCTDVDQVCVEPDDSVYNDWYCECKPPGDGQAAMAAAVCILNECEATCTGCENGVCQSTWPPQTCFDPDQNASSTGDWRCVCPNDPSASARGGVVNCPFDECTEDCTTTCEQGRCAKGHLGQTCSDPNPTLNSRWDWMCVCPYPSSKTRTGGDVASCSQDECELHNTCQNRQQTCTDLDENKPDDWQCTCVAPLNGSAMTEAANCTIDECDKTCDSCEKGACDSGPVSQTCNDPDHSELSTGDWTCTCPAPSTLYATKSVANCPLDECKEACPTCAGATCSANNQSCSDPIPMSKSLSNWVCACDAPANYTQLTAPVQSCDIDECTLHNETCNDANQDCHDPNHSIGFDWLCVCRSPLSGSELNGIADCAIDECNTTCSTCENGKCDTGVLPQTCSDPDHSEFSTSDWTCTCPSPSFNAATQNLADCPLDECDAICPSCEQDACANASQTCYDPFPMTSSLSDWNCTCQYPSNATEQAAAVASCDRDECEIHAPTCEAANQTCYDVNASIPHDWMCACRSPLSGEETSKVAACFVDECVSSCESCEEGLCSTGDPIETCDDPNNSSLSLSDWTCTCPFPSTRFATVNKADCPRDECIVDGCSTCANGTCAQSGQNCSDPVAMTSSLSDWVCSCPFPSNATATAAAAATCDTNECDISRYNMICMVAGQECVDPDESVTDDWMCRCVWPLSGHATGSAVNCTIDECEENCQTCERDMCSSAYPVQICHDPDHSSDSQSDWICACQAPSNNTGYTNLASCPLNECEDTMCATCANGTCVRGDGDQTCTDPGPSSSSLSDWFCRCAAPANYTQTAAAVVSCSIDECTIHNSTCTRGNQTCEDLDQAAHYNWECVCNDPLSGRGTMELAECTIDECEVTCGTCENSMCETGAVEETCTDLNISALSRQDWACSCPAPSTISAIYNLADCPLDECSVTCATCSNQTCTDAGQTCYDPEPRSESLSDWICSCVPPAMQKAVASAADICAYDECLSFNATCASANQTCEDPNWETYSDWVCWCPLPFEGNATAGISHCEINECEKTCASCEEDLCATAGQSCEDPDSSWKSLSDWLCRCPEPSVGHAFTSVSHCTLNECNTTCPHCANTICSGASQLCDDPNTTASSTNDWWCRCPSPSLGLNKTSAVDFCLYDECSVPENENVCLNHTQECVDVDTEVFSLDDWECNCISPPALENNSTVTGPTLCSYQGECETDPEALLCLAKGHLCWDPDTDIHSLGDWECSCVTPFKGETAVNSSDILCEVNECETNCSTCAITNEYPNQPNLCEIEGQTCTDLNLTTLHDWQCQCPFPSTTLASTATPAPACVVDECLAVCPSCSKGACTSVNQTCVDPDTDVNSLSDWTCTCPSPGVGDATAKAALCVCDECLLYSDCPDAWQSCYDADTTCNNVQPDFVCTCPPGSNGTAIGEAVAMCTIDECVEFGDTCALSGQTCVDDDKMTNGTWVCHCPMPANGSALMAVSSCTLDECLKDCKHCENDTCASAKQDCTDPDTRLESSHDWFCECRFPGVGKATARAASCDCDECVTDVICSSANQTCNDGNLTCADGGAKDYTCTCQDPFTGVAEAAVAVCKWDECAEHELACTNKKQNCYDPDLVNLDTWQCVCLPNATGSALMQAAECSLDECAAICDSCENSACENAGQKCNDPDIAITSLGDWTCECNVGTGKATQAPADCKCDECLDTLECDLADQICTDSNHTCGGGDFTCSCKLPWQGVGTAGAAVCEMDECKQNGYVCQAMNQTCTDYELTTENTWSCTCPLPSHGTSNMSAAACVLDECEESCPHCENGACEEEAQLCIDMDNSSQSRRDWMCLCQEPGVGNATAKPAECVCNECLLYSTCTNAGQDCNDLETSCSKLQKPNYVCTCRAPSFGSANNVAADCQLDECQDNQLCGGQKCEDPDFLKNGDWFCKCPPPSHGSAVGEPATCILNECNETCSHCANGTCTQQTDKQTCHDPDTNATSTSDWTCTCSIGVGSATAKAATCVCDECSIGINACQPFGQDCRDNVQTCNTAPDFQCICPSPYTGSAVGTNATCTLDECKQYASICSAVGQDCIDSDHLVLNNWICQCKSPSEGEGRMEAAYCVLDECAKECETCSNNTCTDADQICSEGNTSSLMTSDWTCSCKFPGVGSAVTNAAVCVCDECLMFDVCQSEGQSCFDADKSCDKLDDFTCTCALPAVGTGTASAAVCLTNECKQYNGTCLTKGQTCFDPNQTVADDWECHCPEPAVGTEVMGPATCFLNECNTSCTHCANGTCDSVGQTCNDPNMEVDYTNDWTCTCVAPAKGEAMANAAECVCNECETDDTCLAANQSCEDVNTTCGEVPDFVCSCDSPAYGSAVGEAAECLIDECTTVLACESMQQICLDENRTADANWICMCPNGTTGEPGQQGATTCLLDECTASCPTCAEDTCSNMGQACVERTRTCLA